MLCRDSTPLPARSSVLINDGKGRFTDATEKIAPDLAQSGLVTSAICSDADNDGWIDLFVTHEWGAIKFFRNLKGQQFENRTESAGLNAHTGWWNSITAADFDNDGDMDYVAGNFGRNTKYHPEPDRPEVLYFGNFDASGKPHLIEAKYDESGKCLPRRGFSCSREAMPFLRKKMKTFHNFASASLEKIYTRDLLSSAQRFEASTFDSSYLENDGTGTFTVHALPPLAQIAPVFGMAATDFDADGWPDLFLAQNFNTPQRETGPMDGGLSLLLKGNPSAKSATERFIPMWPRESGIAVPGDAKGAGYGDLNGDLHPDLVVGVNSASPALFLNLAKEKNRIPLAIQLKSSKRGNPTAIGAKVTVKISEFLTPSAEVLAGTGYLSQNSAVLFFGIPRELKNNAITVDVRWPDGSKTHFPTIDVDPETPSITVLKQPTE